MQVSQEFSSLILTSRIIDILTMIVVATSVIVSTRSTVKHLSEVIVDLKDIIGKQTLLFISHGERLTAIETRCIERASRENFGASKSITFT